MYTCSHVYPFQMNFSAFNQATNLSRNYLYFITHVMCALNVQTFTQEIVCILRILPYKTEIVKSANWKYRMIYVYCIFEPLILQLWKVDSNW